MTVLVVLVEEVTFAFQRAGERTLSTVESKNEAEVASIMLRCN